MLQHSSESADILSYELTDAWLQTRKSCHRRTNLTDFSIKVLANPLREDLWFKVQGSWSHTVHGSRFTVKG